LHPGIFLDTHRPTEHLFFIFASIFLKTLSPKIQKGLMISILARRSKTRKNPIKGGDPSWFARIARGLPQFFSKVGFFFKRFG